MAFSFNSTPAAAAKPTFSFGAASTPAAASTNAASKPPTFSFNSSGTGSTTTPAGGLFGQASQQQQPSATGTTGGAFSGFGQQQNSNSNAATGSTPAAPAASGFSFGGFGANKPAATTTTTSTPAAGTNPFANLGSSTTQQAQTSTPSFGGFGNTAASTSTPAPTFSFGASSTSQPQQQQQTGFGQTSTNALQSSQTAGNANAAAGNNAITKSTKFEDLPEQARKMIEEIETYIQGRHAIYDSLASPCTSASSSSSGSKLGSEIEQTSTLLRTLSIEFSALSNHLSQDSRATQDLRSRFEQSLRDAVKAVQIVDAVRAPASANTGGSQGQQSGFLGAGQQGNQGSQVQQGASAGQGGQSGRPHPAFLQEFFHRKAEDLTRRLSLYQSTISSLQSHLHSLPSSSSSFSTEVSAILPTLKAQHAATLQSAARLSNLESQTGELKDEYRTLWRERTGSVRDPFSERRREVLGSEVATLDANRRTTALGATLCLDGVQTSGDFQADSKLAEQRKFKDLYEIDE